MPFDSPEYSEVRAAVKRDFLIEAAQHKDDEAVDALAKAMKQKLAKQRAKGYGGWDGEDCSREYLQAMMKVCVVKGCPVDVANFCAFLFYRGEGLND